MKQVHPLSPPMNGVIFERMKAKYTPDFARVLDAWKWENGVTFSVKIRAKDGRATRYDGISKIAEYSYGYNIPEKKYSYLLFFQDYNLVQITNPHQKINWRYNMHRLTLHYLESMNYL